MGPRLNVYFFLCVVRFNLGSSIVSDIHAPLLLYDILAIYLQPTQSLHEAQLALMIRLHAVAPVAGQGGHGQQMVIRYSVMRLSLVIELTLLRAVCILHQPVPFNLPTRIHELEADQRLQAH